MGMTLREHEKFIAFLALLISLMIMAVMLRLWPLADNNQNSAVLQILNLIVGGLLGGFGAAVQALLKASTDTVKVANAPSDPVPVAPTPDGELPEEQKL
jgi:ABC-type uncharacterized transport system permease subunit